MISFRRSKGKESEEAGPRIYVGSINESNIITWIEAALSILY
tara:strand:- start:3006 stop:3131 length:126 start_codon:yes stop_codon:yes gene_type:complete